jgi:putative transposase
LVKLKRYRTPFRKILTHRVWIERIQRRYFRSWRFVKGVRRAVKKHGERIENISWDYSHETSNLIADLALRHCSIIILEDLDELRDSAKKGRRFNKKQFCIEYEARERGLEAVKVSPRNTSSKCPRCSSKLVDNGYRTLRCSKCNFIGERRSGSSKPIQKILKMWSS